MAISIRGSAGAWVAANATTQTVTLPTHATGDMLLVRVGMKHATLPGSITCATAGWAKIGQFNNGTTASGNGTGDVCVAVFWKIATSAAETNPVITYHASVAATPSCASPIVFQKGGDEAWIEPPIGDGGAIAAATSISATIQTHLAAQSGDMIVAFLVTNDNTTLTVPTFTQSGLTLATVTEAPATALSDATSNDISADACYRLVTAGTSSAAAVVTGTNSVADVGAAWTTRLRVVTEPAGTTIYPTDTASAVSGEPTLVSAFTGSDENPLSEGGTWAKVNTNITAQFQRLSNQVAPTTTGTHADYYNAANYGPDVEAYVTVATTGSTYKVLARIQGEGGASTWDAYAFGWIASQFGLSRYDNNSETSLSLAAGSVSAGDKIAIVCRGPTIQGWHYTGGTWTLKISATDSTYASAGKVGLQAQGSTALRLDDLYAGTSTTLFSTDVEAWTSRGSGVLVWRTLTVAGPTAPIQVKDDTSPPAGGGTVVDWFTRPLTAFTLGGAVRCNIRMLQGGGAHTAPHVEIARVDGDGTSPTVWGAVTWNGAETPAVETARSFLVTGSDLAITNGQRLRIRIAVDDSAAASMLSGADNSLYFNGTSGGASGDTYLTFTQTLTEFSAGTTVTPTTVALVVTKYAPTVTTPNPQLVTPTTKALVSATFAPQARTPILATPAAVSLTVTKYAPTVTTSNNQRVTPTTATLTATKYAPTVTTPERVTPTTKALALATFAPTVTVAAGAISVTVPAGTLTLATFAPTIRLAIRVTPNAVSLITSPQVPTVTASDHQRVTPTTKALALATFAPTVTTPSPQLVTPTTAALVATKYAPIVGTRYYAAAIATGPLVWWRHGEPSGTTADDEIGSIDATYINTPTLGVTGLITGDTNTAARFSRASLEYTTTFATMPAGSSVGVSIKGWVVFDTVTAATIYGIARWFHTTPVAEVQFYYHVSGNALRYLYQDATGFRNTFSDAWTPSTATRYFLVVTHDYSAELVKFYVNGALLSSEDVSAYGVPVVHAVNGNASVARVGSDYFDGIIDEPAFYNGVLTPTQILALYNAGSGAAGPQLVTPTTASLVITKYQPTVTTPQTFTPTTASLTATKYAPTVRLPILATPTTKALTVTRYEPTVRLHQLVTPQKATLTATRFAPTATTPIRAVPGTKSLALTPFAPVVTAGNVQSVTPTTAAILLASRCR